MSAGKSKTNDARKAVRRALRYPVWIDLDDSSPPSDCMLADVSETGAKFKIPVGSNVPDQFRLRLTRDGHSIRHCQVVRREGVSIAVKFVSKPSGEDPSSDQPPTNEGKEPAISTQPQSKNLSR